MKRSEVILLAFSMACAMVVMMARLGWLQVAGSVPLGLYPLYSIAALGGWLSGNVFVARRASRSCRVSLLVSVYLIAPVGPLFLLRVMGSAASQQRAPLVPIFTWVVFAILFLVPVSLRSTTPRRRRMRVRNADRPDSEPSRDRHSKP